MYDGQLVEADVPDNVMPDDPALALVEVDEESESSLCDDEGEEEEDASGNDSEHSNADDRAYGTRRQPQFQHINALKLRRSSKRKRNLTLGLELSQDACFYLSGMLELLMEILWEKTIEMARIENASDEGSVKLKLRHLLKVIDVDPSLNAVFSDSLMDFDPYCMNYVGPRSKRQRTIDERELEAAQLKKEAERAAREEEALIAREEAERLYAMDDDQAPPREAGTSPPKFVKRRRRKVDDE